VDKNVLRMALWELRHHPDLPKGLVIEHAVELARRYSTDESPKFVNGILGAFVRRRQNQPPSA
jgi:N utilization substance protein B